MKIKTDFTPEEIEDDILFVLNDYCPKNGWASRLALRIMLSRFHKDGLSKMDLKVLDKLIAEGKVFHQIRVQGCIRYHVYNISNIDTKEDSKYV